jgi:hypothetical protein
VAEAKVEPLGIIPRRVEAYDPSVGYFVEEVRRQLIQRYGEKAEQGPNSVYAGGLWVRTSLDPQLQKAAQDSLRAGLLRYLNSQPEDEFAVGYELWDRGNLNLVPKKPDVIQYEYARQALKNGLALEQELGTNPFKFGLVSGSDAHTGLTAMEENNFFCKFVSCEPRPERWSEDALKFGDRSVKGWEVTAAGYTGVWVSGNTREAIWDALKRKEVYSSSGPRMLVRFFGGYDFDEHDAATRAPAEVGYQKGVPMGGDLQSAPEGKVPTFLVAALKDPIGANLDRIQIIKGWLDPDGKTHETIYDVVWGDADKRKPQAEGKIPPVGSTVDLANANWTNTIGDPELITVWKDPDFDPSLRAFYYARILEIPTPRWTAYDAKRFNVKMGEEVPMTTQERAFTSPIWYSPKREGWALTCPSSRKSSANRWFTSS